MRRRPRAVGAALAAAVVVVAVVFAVDAPAASAETITIIDNNIAGGHNSRPNTAGAFSHFTLTLNKLSGNPPPEVMTFQEVCSEQAWAFSASINNLWPGLYSVHFNNAWFGGQSLPANEQWRRNVCPNSQMFGNLIYVKRRSPDYVAGGLLPYQPPLPTASTFPGERKVWACMTGGEYAARYNACVTHFWPTNYAPNGYAPSGNWKNDTMKWFNINIMNPHANRNLVVGADLYMTRAEINAATPPGLLTWWKDAFGCGPPYADLNSGTFLLGGLAPSTHYDHVIFMPSVACYGSGSLYYLPPGASGYEYANVTDHTLLYARLGL